MMRWLKRQSGGGGLSLFIGLLAFAALSYLVFSLIVYGFSDQWWQGKGFRLLGVFRVFPTFIDLRWITTFSECGFTLADVGKGRSCGLWSDVQAIAYPPLSFQVARWLGIEVRHTGLLGFSMGMSLIAVVLIQLYRSICTPWLRHLAATILMLGLPMQLALERSNIDVMIFLLLTSLCAAIATMRVWSLPFVVGLSFVTVGVKLYPVVGLVAWVGRELLRRRRLDLTQFAVLIGSALGVTSLLSWHLSGVAMLPTPSGDFTSHAWMSTGLYLTANLLAVRLALLSPSLLVLILLGIKMLALVVPLVIAYRHGLATLWSDHIKCHLRGFELTFMTIYPMLMTCVWIGCYLLSSSYEYRMIFVFPALIACLSLGSDADRRAMPLSRLLRLLLFAVPVIFSPFLLLMTLDQLHLNGHPLLVGVAIGLEMISDYLAIPMMAGVLLALLLPPRRQSAAGIAGKQAPLVECYT